MQTLINNLMQFSRNSVLASDFLFIQMNDRIKEVLVEFETEIEKTGTEIHTDFLPGLCVIPSLMRQTFYKLISNAIKFRNDGVAPVISIRANKLDASDISENITQVPGINHPEATTSDNGIGFDTTYAANIFKVFKRLHSYQESEGTGVG